MLISLFDPGGNSIVIRWKLLNQGCVAMFDVVCDGPADPLETSLTYQLVGIPSIKEETVSRYEVDEANQPAIVKVLDWVFFYIPGSMFVAFSFWFWFDSVTESPENLEQYHFLPDITWIGMGVGLIICGISIASFCRWFYQQFIERE